LKKCFKFTKENSSSLGIVYRPIVKVGLRDSNGEPFELHKIPISIDDREVETRVAFALSEVPNLLGRLDIFKNFEISFRKEEEFCFSD